MVSQHSFEQPPLSLAFVNLTKQDFGLSRFAYTEETRLQRRPKISLHAHNTMSRKDPPPPPPKIISSRTKTESSYCTAPSQQEETPPPPKKTVKPAANNTTKPLKSNTTTSRVKQSSTLSRAKQVASKVTDRIIKKEPNTAAAPTRKRPLEFVDLSGPDDVTEEVTNNRKRIRTVAAPKTMGAMVSSIVGGYENMSKENNDQAKNHQRPIVASKAKMAPPPTDTVNVAPYRELPDFRREPAAIQALRRNPSTTSLSLPAGVGARTGQVRFFQCNRCRIMTPYDYDAHMLDELLCGNPACMHPICGDCSIDSPYKGYKGEEICEEMPWHDQNLYPKGYWQWRGQAA